MTIREFLRHTVLVAGAACLALSCRVEMPENPAQSSVSFGIDTRAVDDNVTPGTTYRIMAYKPTTRKFVKEGTYMLERLPEEGGVAELTPCSLDADGNVTDGAVSTFDGTNATYSLVFVSPGIKGNDDGSFDIDLSTLGDANGCRFVASELPEAKIVGNYGRIVMTHPMKKCIAHIGIDFYKAGGVADFEIEDLKITGAGANGETVRFFPAKRQVRVSSLEGGIDISLTKPSESRADEKENTLLFTTAEDDRPTVVSAIYAPREVVKDILGISDADFLEEGAYLAMHCRLRQQERDPVTVALPLTANWPEVLPQRKYIYRVVVSSNYINLSVDVFGDASNEWEDGNSGDGGTIGGAVDRIELGKWEIVRTPGGEGWELRELDNQTIG